MSEKEVAFVDLTTAEESRDEVVGEEVVEESRDTAKTDAIDVSEVQSALEQVDLEGEEEEEAGETRDEADTEEEARDEAETEDESRDVESESREVKNESHEVKEDDTTDIKEEHTTETIKEDTKDVTTDTTDTKDTTTDPIDLTVDDLESPIALETKEVLEMTEDGHVDEEEEEVDDMEEEEEEEANSLAVPQTPKSESSFGEFASEDEFGDFDDFEEMEEPAVSEQQQVPTLDTSREDTPMASQTNLSAPSQAAAPVSVKSVLTDDSFSSFTSLSFATKSVLEDNGLTQTFVEAKEPAGQSFELSESASQIYALLCSVPNSELNFLKSFTRRLLLKDVGVPLDLDELLPRKEKQHFVIRRSRRSLDKAAKTRTSTDKNTPGGSRAATPTPTDSSRAQTPVTVDTELKLDSWLRLVEIRPEQRERMEPEEVRELVTQLKTANVEAKLLLKQWQDKLALGYKNKEAFEAVVENMVGFAQKQRLKKGKK